MIITKAIINKDKVKLGTMAVAQLFRASDTSGQSYKASTSVKYISRFVLTTKLLLFMTLET